MITVLAFYCCVTNDHQCRGEPNVNISSECCRSEFQPGMVGLSAQGCKVKIKVLAKLSSHLEVLGEKLLPSSAGCWQDSGPHGCRTEGPVSCWLPAWGCSHLLEATHIPCHRVASIFQASSGLSNLFVPQIFNYYPFCEQPEKML